MRLAMGIVIAAGVCVASCGSSSNNEDEDDPQLALKRCNDLRDHVIDLRLGTLPAVEGVDMAPHRAALKKALGDRFIESCRTSMTPEQVKCALSAADSAAAVACGPENPPRTAQK